MRRREQEGSRPLDEDVPEVLGAGDIAAQDADRLAQRPDLDRNPAMQAEVIDGAPTVTAEDAGRMGVVDKHRRVHALGGLDDAGKGRDVAVHAEDAVGHHEDQPIGETRALAALLDGVVQDIPE